MAAKRTCGRCVTPFNCISSGFVLVVPVVPVVPVVSFRRFRFGVSCPWRDIFKCQSFTETLCGVPWPQRFFLIFHRMEELRESREAANTIREAARDTVRRLTKTSLPQKYFHRFPLLGGQIVRTAFHRFKR